MKPGQKLEWKGARLPLYELTQILGKAPGFPEEAALSRVARIGAAPGPVALVIRARTDLPTGIDDVLVVLTFDAKGKNVAFNHLASSGSSEAGSQTDTVTLQPGGTFEIATKSVVPLHDVPQLEELVTSASAKVRIGLDGSVAQVDRVRGPDGRFDDLSSKEVLIVSFAKKKVLYRATPEKPVQELAITLLDPKAGAATVAFSSSKAKLYKLAWSADRTEIVCTDPDGKAQTFQRVW